MSLLNRLRALRYVGAENARIDSDLLAKFGKGKEFTPDYFALEEQEFSLVFVADEMMSGLRCNSMVNNDHATRLTAAYTEDQFVVYRKQFEDYECPVILEPSKEFPVFGPPHLGTPKPAILKGELYIVRAKQMVQLDIYKQNGKVFTRKRVKVTVKVREEQEYLRQVTAIRRTASSDSVATFVDMKDKVLGEWQIHKDHEAFMYVGNPEFFYWSNFSDDTFRPLRPKVPNDRNLKPFYYYSPDAIK